MDDNVLELLGSRQGVHNFAVTGITMQCGDARRPGAKRVRKGYLSRLSRTAMQEGCADCSPVCMTPNIWWKPMRYLRGSERLHRDYPTLTIVIPSIGGILHRLCASRQRASAMMNERRSRSTVTARRNRPRPPPSRWGRMTRCPADGSASSNAPAPDGQSTRRHGDGEGDRRPPHHHILR